MARLCLFKGRQNKFLENIKKSKGCRWDDIAQICKVHPRTLRDWAREKYKMNYESALHLSKISKITIPSKFRVLSEYWSTKKASRIGGRRFAELYGSPGTPEGRRKGGLMSQRKFRLNQEFARRIGVAIRKNINYPQKSPALAEFIGIMLGDGGFSNDYQITISFNYKQDMSYAYYIQKLIKKLFGISSTVRVRKKYGSGDIVISSKNLSEFLQKYGIQKGNKIIKQVDIPKWIFESNDYEAACLRGLIDTDGCFYRHKYKVNGKEYIYLKMCFTSYSQPLLNSVIAILQELGFNPKNTAKNRVYLYTMDQINRYFEKVGSNNKRYLDFYKKFIPASN